MGSDPQSTSSGSGTQPVAAEIARVAEGAATDARPITRNSWLQVSLRRVCRSGSAPEHFLPQRKAGDFVGARDGIDCIDDRVINILLLILVFLLVVLVFVG